MMFNEKIFPLVLICGLIFQCAFSQIRLPRLVSDSMILQRDKKIKIWGWAAIGEKIAINFNNRKYNTAADSSGRWAIMLPSMKAGGPYMMEVVASNHITLKNILIGDVWVCSGQSNMELPMDRLKDRYPDVIAAAVNPNIRQFNVSTRFNFQSAQEDFATGNWETATPRSVLHFTAVGYFFAKALYEKNHVPVGLIKSAVGGSPAEAWLSEDALKEFPIYLATAQKFKNDNYIDSIRKADSDVNTRWYNNIWLNDTGLQEKKKWFDTSYDASSWKTMNVPGYWQDEGLPHTNGVVWFRKEIDVPALMIGKPVRLFLGNIVDRDSVYINGVFIGTTPYQYPPRKYDVPETLLKEGKNVVVVRVINYAGVGGFFKDKPYKISTAKDSVDLKGEWKFKLGLVSSPIAPTTTLQYQPAGLFNAMIGPLLSYSIKGVIWYQGESNTSRAKEYQKLFPALISNWREKWGQQKLPFLYVQLANFMQTKEQPAESQWAELREAQLKTLAVPHTAMIVTTDIGEWNDIHPLDKEDVGIRLALAAGKIAYGKNKIVYSGPIYQSYKIEGNKIILYFTSVGNGLIAKGGNSLKHFSISGSDKKFIWAKTKIENNKVVVWSDEIKNPVAVRYAWADDPADANLYNKEGLPASAFRTDE
jgi:sialate O-acetylesterase